MNKKIMKLLAGMFVLVMVVASCSSIGDEVTPETAMEKTDEMSDEIMDKDSEMTDETKDKDGEMTDESMDKDDEMSDESMDKDDEMSDESMDKDGEMTDDSMDKNDEMTDDSMDKHDEMTDESMEKEDDMAMMTNEGDRAPEFSFTDLNGNTHTLDDYEGKKVYIKYWASWCSICLAGLGEIDELFAETEDFVVLTVVTPGANGEQSKEDFINWFNGLGYDNINVLFDTDGEIGKDLRVRAFPTSVFIGSDGVLIETAPGHKSNEDINAKIETFH